MTRAATRRDPPRGGVDEARGEAVRVRRAGGAMTRARLAVCAAAALLAAAAIGGAGDRGAPGPAVVAVEAPGQRSATGFVAADGRVVTVAHAVARGPVTVRGADGVARRAAVVRRDPSLDLAVLAVGGGAIPPAARPALPLAGAGAGMQLLVRRDRGPVAEDAVVVRRLDARVRTGDGRLLARRPALELRVRVAAGDSGAPLVGRDGRVAGVLFARSEARAGVAYAVDASVLDALLR